MSANIDKSLGEIISSRKPARGGATAQRTRRGAARAPVGGIAKNVARPRTTATRSNTAVAAAAAAGPIKGNKKIMVSGLPSDVNEQQIKDYFGSRVGPVSRVELNYGPNGVSRGVATILFRGDVAQKAVAENNGVKVDGRPMKVEIVYDAKHLPPTQPAKTLSERVAEPRKAAAAARKDQPKKDQPKKVRADEKGAASAKGGRGGKRGRNADRARPQKKTQEDLDAEMADYFDPKTANGDAAATAAPAAGVAAAPAVGGETMDEVL